ncbi:MAG: glycosyltransferase family 4 protein [Promethearchaeota archaeon]
MLRICLVAPIFPIFPGRIEGGGNNVYRLAKWLKDKGHKVSVIVPNRVLRNPEGIDVYSFTGPFRSAYPLYKILSLLKKIDIIHCHWCDYVSFFATIVGKLARKPTILTLRGAGIREYPKHLITRVMVVTLLKMVDRVVAIHRGLFDRALLLKAPRRKTSIIPNAIDVQKFKPIDNGNIRETYGIGDAPLVISVGLAKLKGPEYILRAVPLVLEEIPNAKFMFIGTIKEQMEDLANLAKKLKIADSLTFLSGIPNEEMPKYFSAADVDIHDLKTSHSGKGAFGMAHLEAMACETPIMTRTCAPLIEGFTGLSVTPNVLEISEKIIYLLKNRNYCNWMGKNARKLITLEYASSIIRDRYLKLYNEVLSEKMGSLLRICLVAPIFPIFPGRIEGGGNNVYRLAKWLKDKGHKVSVIVPNRVLRNPEGIDVYSFTGPFRSAYPLYKILSLLKKIDIIHCHWCDYVSFFATIVGKLARKPTILTLRGAGIREYPKHLITRVMVVTLLKMVDRVVAIHRGLFDRALLLKAPRRKTSIIPNAIDVQKFKPIDNGNIRETYGIGDAPLVISVGLAKLKGPEYILRAVPLVLEEIPNAKFMFIGTIKEQMEDLANLAKKLKIADSLTFLSGIPNEEMPKYFSAADVDIHDLKTSHSGKGAFGMAHLEAMACETPIMTRTCAPLIEGFTGLSVTPNVLEISEKIIYLLKNRNYCNWMGKNARKLITLEYESSIIRDRYIILYYGILSGEQ